MALREPCDVSARLGDLRQDGLGQGDEPVSNGRKAQRPDVFLDQGGAVVALQRLELVRKRRLGQKQARRRLGQAAAFGKGQQGFEMTQFQRGRSHEPASSVP